MGATNVAAIAGDSEALEQARQVLDLESEAIAQVMPDQLASFMYMIFSKLG
jgi:hypothetical protein